MLPAKAKEQDFISVSPFKGGSDIYTDDCTDYMVFLSNGSNHLKEPTSLLNCPLVPVGMDRRTASGLTITFVFICMYICIIPEFSPLEHCECSL